jgi:hypothetical protein
MADKETFTPTPYFDHIPDEYTDAEKAEGASWELGAGHYELGFEVNGARFPLARVKGGGVQKKLKAAKDRAAQQAASQPAPSATDDSAV